MNPAFVDELRKSNLNINSVIITKDEKTQKHVFRVDKAQNIRSITKVATCFGVYKAIEGGYFSLDTKINNFFKDIKITNANNIDKIQHVTISNLLSLTMGHEKGLMFSKDMASKPKDTNWIEYILNEDIEHEPGTWFVYNNADSYLLSAIIQKTTGMKLSKWVQKTVFDEMGIVPDQWEATSQGIDLGGSGLCLSNDDLHKLAVLLLNEGMYEGKQIIDSRWVKEMRTPKFITADLPEYVKKKDRSLNKMAYGYHVWICGNQTKEYPKDAFFVDGADGQFLIIVPSQHLAVTILSEQKDMSPIYPILGLLLES